MATKQEAKEHLNVLLMNPDGVAQWITSLGLPYSSTFKEHQINGAALKILNREVKRHYLPVHITTCVWTCVWALS